VQPHAPRTSVGHLPSVPRTPIWNRPRSSSLSSSQPPSSHGASLLGHPTRRSLSKSSDGRLAFSDTNSDRNAMLRKKTRSLINNSDLRAAYERELANRRKNAAMYGVQAKAAMNTGADPSAEAEPHVLWRQFLKDHTRSKMHPAIRDLVASRQEQKYKAPDPNLKSLMTEHMETMSGESAAFEIIESSTRGAAAFFREFSQLADAMPDEWHEDLHREWSATVDTEGEDK
jgi:hypothetical protein